MTPTTSTSTLPGFLGLQGTDFWLIEHYRDLLVAEAPALAHAFYDYLLTHPATAAVFRNFSPARLDALIQKQVEHVGRLLTSHLDNSWQESMRRIGALHHHLGINPAWIAGAYTLYWRHWQMVLQEQVPASDRNPLRDALFRLLIGDLMVQLDGYARASQKIDAERMALLDVLLGVLGAPRGDESTQSDRLLQQICEALPRKSANVRLAGYLVSSAMEEMLTLECLAGIPLPAIQIRKIAGDPCWEALESRHAVIQSVDNPQAPEWVKTLRGRIGEIGIFPFVAEDLRGVCLIGVREKGHFHRVGSAYFDAFAHLGELVLQLRNQALRDPLTGLPNRTLFLDRLEIARKQMLRHERLLGVALLDLDGFKQVNDRLGHDAGDQLLQTVVQRLQAQLRAGDTIARMGGDEFGLLLPDLERLDDLEFVCGRLLAILREPLEVHGEAVSVSSSIGITLYPLDDSDSRTLMQHADLALYAAKDAGRDQFHLYTLALDEAVQAEAKMRVLLEQALREDRLVLHYQPIVASVGTVLGMEALIRLEHPEKGLLAPAAFFSALDHPRLARSIGRFTLDAALRQAAIWQRDGLALRVAVNISTRHLLDARFLKDLQEALAKHSSVPPEQFEIEITESAPLLNLAEAQSVLKSCQNLGVRIALDDFGTGNASLTYLQQLPAHAIKIDQSFVRNMTNDPKDLAIVAGVITTSRMLGTEVIAEGVETAEHAALLAKMGCSHLQGHLFSKPIPAEDIPAWITGFHPILRLEDALTPMDVLPPILEGHILHVQEFLHALRQGNPFPAHVLEEDAENYCYLGRWLRGEGSFLLGESPNFAGLLARHERIHRFARTAKSLLDSGDMEGAMYQGDLLELENQLLLKDLATIKKEMDTSKTHFANILAPLNQ